MITISNCPLTGLQRKVNYNFHWFTKLKQIIIECEVHFFKNDIEVDSTRIKPYTRNLVASDSLVRNDTGQVLTPQEILDFNQLPFTPTYGLMEEYDFYAYVLGVTPIILPQLIEQIILVRDSENKFDI